MNNTIHNQRKLQSWWAVRVQRLVRRWYVTTNCGMAAKGDNGDNPQWFGRCWGFWLPRLRWNGGKHWRGECCDVTVQWLCFWVGFTIWSHTKPTSQQSNGTGKVQYLERIAETADALESWLGKNTGTNDDWPIEIKADEDGAAKLVSLLRDLNNALVPYRHERMPNGKVSDDR